MKILTRVNVNGLCRQKTIDVEKLNLARLFNWMDSLFVKEMMMIIPLDTAQKQLINQNGGNDNET